MTSRLPRKLVAILYADVAEYSRHTGENEDETHAALGAALDRFAEIIAAHRGQVMHYAGDALLARFDAVVDATSAALEFQARDHGRGIARRIRFRIGINLGDVIEDRGDIYGDGVNVAARLESLAPAGGMCVSDSVRNALGNRLELDYEDLGEQAVKNIAAPVHAYRVATLPAGDDALSAQAGPEDLPERPSIAVLPFANMSGDPEQEYFSDGITEDIITALSCISGLSVVARNSTMLYKNRAVDIKQVGREQQVSYVLEGSVRKSGDRIRVTAQLIDARSGHHLWADRYDRALDDIFAVQDDITHQIMVEMRVKLSLGEKARMLAGRTRSVEVWQLQLRADELNNTFVREYNREARRLIRKGLEIDPGYVSAWTELGWTYCLDALCGWSTSVDDSIAEVRNATRKALQLEPEYPNALALMGYVYMLEGDHDKALESAEKANELSPENSEIVAEYAHILLFAGMPETALDLARKAIRQTPMGAMWHITILGFCQHVLGDQAAAEETFLKAISLQPDSAFPRIYLVSTLVEAGRLEDALQMAREVVGIEHNFSVGGWRGAQFRDAALRERIHDNLLRAGLPA